MFHLFDAIGRWPLDRDKATARQVGLGWAAVCREMAHAGISGLA